MERQIARRVAALEAAAAPTDCETCASRPVFTISDDDAQSAPCPECGREPFVFSIAVDRAAQREDDAA
jgi:hypothetical protein